MTVEVCACTARKAMAAIHLFRYSPVRDGWIFVSSPHYAWTECPYCQQLLPSTSCVKDALEDEKRGFSQADGEAGG